MNDSWLSPLLHRQRSLCTRPRRTVAVVAAVTLMAGCVSAADDGPGADTAISVAPTAAPPTAAPPTRATATTAPATTETATTEPDTSAATYDFSGVGPVVEAFVDRRGLDGAGLVVVERDDGVVHEEYWGEFDADRVSLIASASKMIVAGVVLALDEASVLDIDAPVADVADWGTGNPTITPAQLLSNSSGLPGLFPEPGYGPYTCQFLPAGTLQDCVATIFTTPDDDADVIPPDTEFRYGGAQWQVAGAVAEVASGKSWAELIDKIYVHGCGIDSLAFNNHWSQFGPGGFDYPIGFDGDPSTLQPTENPNMEGGAYITAPDYAQLLLVHLRDGQCEGRSQILSPESLERMHTDRTGATYDSDTAYGMGWWVDEANDRITDPGAYGAAPWLDLDDGYGAYLVVEADTATGNALADELYPLVEAAIAEAG